jgi:hypothetical protein
MKNYLALFSISLILVFAVSCEKHDVKTTETSEITVTEDQNSNVRAEEPPLTWGKKLWRFKREKKGCWGGFSICHIIHHTEGGFGDDDPMYTEANLSIDLGASVMIIDLLEEVDTEGAMDLQIDEGFNYPEIDPIILAEIGVGAIYFETGFYPLTGVNIPLGEFGSVIIPIILE